MVAILDSPDFMATGINLKNLTYLKKISYFVKGVFVSYVFKLTSGKLFCFFINAFFSQIEGIKYIDGNYTKILNNSKKISYSNKRIVRVVVNPKTHMKNLFDEYCLDIIEFKKSDLIIDCGANVGELMYSFDQEGHNIEYVGFEPEESTYKNLRENSLQFGNAETYNVALSDKEDSIKLFVDTLGGNSSVEYFGIDDSVEVTTKTLDSFNFNKVKLLKVEAEGHEESVLKGSIETIKITEYISVDYGPEKGVEQATTAPQVTNFLYKNNFRLVATSKHRQVGLFKNQNLENDKSK